MIAMKGLWGNYTLVLLLAFCISALLTPFIRKRCQQNNLFDLPNQLRKIHHGPIPRLGGIAIYLAFFLPLLLLSLTDGRNSVFFLRHSELLLSLCAASSLVFAIGLYDDIKGATVLQKLGVQTAAAVLIYLLDFKITLLSVPFVGSVPLGVLGFPITIFWIVGITNALNFVDGIDGLACGVGFFSVSTMFFLSLFLNHPLTAFFAAALAGAILGFGLYNFAPASIFMGDSGSLFIGFMIAAISLHGSQKSSTAVVLLIPIVALGVPITDTVWAIIRRVGKGLSPFVADKDHIHHRMLDMGYSPRQVTLVLYGVCSLLGITALAMTAVNNRILAAMLIFLSVMMIGGMKILGYTADVVEINALAKQRIEKKRRLLKQQKLADTLLHDIQIATDGMTLQKAVIRFFELLEFDRASLSGLAEHSFNLCWHSPQHEGGDIPEEQLWTMRFPLFIGSSVAGELAAGKYIEEDSSSSSVIENAMLLARLKEVLEASMRSLFV